MREKPVSIPGAVACDVSSAEADAMGDTTPIATFFVTQTATSVPLTVPPPSINGRCDYVLSSRAIFIISDSKPRKKALTCSSVRAPVATP